MRLSTALIIAILFSLNGFCQKRKAPKPDKFAIYRQFIQVGQWCKKFPVEIDLNLSSVLSVPDLKKQTDSSAEELFMHFGSGSFYVKTEGTEQLGNDSLVVIVNEDAKLIHLFRNEHEMTDLYRSVLARLQTDSSLEELSAKYSATFQQLTDSSSAILLKSRTTLSKNAFPKEEIVLTFRSATLEPLKLEQLQRSMISIGEDQEEALLQDNTAVKSADEPNQGSSLLVAEKKSTCQFLKILYDPPVWPISVKDRVVAKSDGNYEPASGYKGFVLSQQF